MASQNSETKYDSSFFSYDDIELAYDGEISFNGLDSRPKGNVSVTKTSGSSSSLSPRGQR